VALLVELVLVARGAGSDSTAAAAGASGRLGAGQITRSSSLARHSLCDTENGPLSYGYPFKPFDRQHPIRGYFGDPRTSTMKWAVYAPGARGPFNLHNGIDIEAPDGTPVYPVATGIATVRHDNVVVTSGGGRWFQYYHVVPSVKSGQRVVAYRTVLGRIQAPFRHVHLLEGDRRYAHNPLDPGHLVPYRDTTAPVVTKIRFRDAESALLDPLRLSGTVEIAADAHDMPALPVEGDWPGLGVAPALLEWELQAPDGQVAVPLTTAVDFRQTEPGGDAFWSVYSIGTRQNKYGSPDLRQVRLVGRYSFRLTSSGLDTTRFPDGVYLLTVRAADTCGNSGTLSEKIAIAN
jgi:hypothetical protein